MLVDICICWLKECVREIQTSGQRDKMKPLTGNRSAYSADNEGEHNLNAGQGRQVLRRGGVKSASSERVSDVHLYTIITCTSYIYSDSKGRKKKPTPNTINTCFSVI